MTARAGVFAPVERPEVATNVWIFRSLKEFERPVGTRGVLECMPTPAANVSIREVVVLHVLEWDASCHRGCSARTPFLLPQNTRTLPMPLVALPSMSPR